MSLFNQLVGRVENSTDDYDKCLFMTCNVPLAPDNSKEEKILYFGDHAESTRLSSVY